MKKFLSLVLALVMTMSLVTVSAGAKDFTDDTAKYFDAWNFGRTDEDSNFFATTALS